MSTLLPIFVLAVIGGGLGVLVTSPQRAHQEAAIWMILVVGLLSLTAAVMGWIG